RVLLNAHVDTVPANEGYTSPPHLLVRRGDRLYGLGTSDIKGAIAAILEALAAGPVTRPVGVLFSGDEEHGGSCIRAFLDSTAACAPRRGRTRSPGRWRSRARRACRATSPASNRCWARASPTRSISATGPRRRGCRSAGSTLSCSGQARSRRRTPPTSTSRSPSSKRPVPPSRASCGDG